MDEHPAPQRIELHHEARVNDCAYDIYLCTTRDGRLDLSLVGCNGDGEVVGKLTGTLPPGDLSTIVPMLTSVLAGVGTAMAATDSRTYRVSEIRQRYPNAYCPWTPDDDQDLIRRYRSGESIEQLSNAFGRGTGAIVSRLAKHGETPNPYLQTS